MLTQEIKETLKAYTETMQKQVRFVLQTGEHCPHHLRGRKP